MADKRKIYRIYKDRISKLLRMYKSKQSRVTKKQERDHMVSFEPPYGFYEYLYVTTLVVVVVVVVVIVVVIFNSKKL
jgi:hypothetical protein